MVLFAVLVLPVLIVTVQLGELASAPATLLGLRVGGRHADDVGDVLALAHRPPHRRRLGGCRVSKEMTNFVIIINNNNNN